MDYPGLFQPGFYDISLDEFNKAFVEPFQDSERRTYLSNRFFALIDKFKEIGISAEIWIDGSFATKKPNPGDIDMIFFVNPEQLDNLSLEKKEIIIELNKREISKIRYQCDVFIIPNNDYNNRSYWRGWFGFSRDESPKGIARIFLEN